MLQANGCDVSLGGDRTLVCAWLDDPIPRVVDVEKPDADVVVFQRPLQRTLYDTLRLLRSKGVATVVEVDDDFEAASSRNPVWALAHPKKSPERNWHWLKLACQEADLVTVSTPALAERYGRHGRCVVLPNCVPERYLKIEKPPSDGKVRVGWTGTPEYHPGDLEVVGVGVASAVKATGATFRAIGSAKTLGVLGVTGEVAPWTPLRDGYPEAIARLDVGIAPLADTAFNRAKSWLKPLEYAALGVASVKSPLPEYLRLGGDGFADRPKDWAANLTTLLNVAAYREDRAGIDRVRVAEYTYEQRADRWWQAWTLALANRHKRAT